jgi:hypothetical protein
MGSGIPVVSDVVGTVLGGLSGSPEVPAPVAPAPVVAPAVPESIDAKVTKAEDKKGKSSEIKVRQDRRKKKSTGKGALSSLGDVNINRPTILGS